MQVTLVTTVL